MDNSAHIILRRGSCSCMPKMIPLPQYFTVDFIHQGEKVALSFNLQHILIPQEEEVMARFESRVHIFLDAHYRGSYWDTSLELCDIHPRNGCNTPYSFRRCVRTSTQDLMLCAKRWHIWRQPTLPLSHDVLLVLKNRLQRHQRKLGWDEFHAWLANMTPPGWTLPESFSVIELT